MYLKLEADYQDYAWLIIFVRFFRTISVCVHELQ